MTFRDDDISVTTTVAELKPIHDLFIKHGITHTIAVICKDLDHNKELVEYLRHPLFDIQVHCWDHIILTECECLIKHIKGSIVMFDKCGFKRPTTLYPPWNKSDKYVDYVTSNNGLKVSASKISLSGYLSGQKSEVINFHYWADECKDLESALIKYKKSLV